MKTRKFFLLFSFALFSLVILISLGITRFIQESKSSGSFGTVSAVSAALISELRNGNAVLEESFQTSNQEWRFLGSSEYDRVISELHKSHNLDAPRGWEPSMRLLDLWGNQYEIGYRGLGGQVYEAIVVSKGPDGILHTKDDVSRGIMTWSNKSNKRE